MIHFLFLSLISAASFAQKPSPTPSQTSSPTATTSPIPTPTPGTNVQGKVVADPGSFCDAGSGTLYVTEKKTGRQAYRVLMKPNKYFDFYLMDGSYLIDLKTSAHCEGKADVVISNKEKSRKISVVLYRSMGY